MAEFNSSRNWRRTGLNEATVRRLIKGEMTGSINSFVLICLARHLPYRISRHIIDNCPHRFNLRNTSHQWYDFALQHLYSKTVEEIKNELAEYGADPL